MAEAKVATIAVVGATGQVGRELLETLAPLGRIVALDRQVVDLTDLAQLQSVLRALRPRVIVNAAAYTQVDQAESERDLAWRLNCEAPAVMAEVAATTGAVLVHYSTDYVFDGRKGSPYTEQDAVRPLQVYGASKAAGEQAVLDRHADSYIFRLAWVYGQHGRNFFRTIQHLARERHELRVVADQFGTPTWSRTVAETTSEALRRVLSARPDHDALPPGGIYHMTAPEETSWHAFATAIVAAMPWDADRPRPSVLAVTSDQFPTKAARPARSTLSPVGLRDVFGLALPSWQAQLARCFDSPG